MEKSRLTTSITESLNGIVSSLIEWSRRISPNKVAPGQDNMSYCLGGDEGKFKTISLESKQETRNVTTSDDSIINPSVPHQLPGALSPTSNEEQTSINYLEQNLIHLQKGFNRLMTLSPQYDYKDDLPGNGLRSLCKIIYNFLKLWEDKVRSFSTFSSSSTRKFKSMTDSTSYLNVVVDVVLLVEEKRKDIVSSSDLLNHFSEIDSVMNHRLLSLEKEQVDSFLSLGPFWLHKNFQGHAVFWTYVTAWRSQPLIKTPLLINPCYAHRRNVDFSFGGNVHQLKKIWSTLDLPISRPLVFAFNGLIKPNIVRKIRVPRQVSYLIQDSYKTKIEITKGNTRPSDKVKCLFLQHGSFGSSPDETLVIHLHGGGFVSIRPKSHEVYLRKFASKLQGVPILSIDYSLSPDAVFPVALQEILDVYLFVTGVTARTARFIDKKSSTESDLNQEIISLIGFHPKNIILMGDSAGSNLSLSLMHVLQSLNQEIIRIQCNVINNNDIIRTTESNILKKIPLPKSLFLPYPYTNPSVTRMTPSRTFMAFDPVLPIGSLYALSEAYHPILNDENGKEEIKLNMSFTAEEKETNNNNIRSSLTDLKRRSLITSQTSKKKTTSRLIEDPWYRKSKESFERRASEMESLNFGPFFHPLSAKFEDCLDFKGITMFIQVGEFDPLFDEAILLAKKWTGRVTLDILPELSHGFHLQVIFSKACRKASKQGLRRLQEAIGLSVQQST